MYYLKCSQCAEYSALRSEYITFCEHCGKKFPLPYSDWKAKHLQGTFEMFRQEAGVPEARYTAEMRKRHQRRFDLRKKAALITGFVVLIACSALGAYYGPSLFRMFREPAVPATMLNVQNWRTFRGNLMRLQTPLSLSPAAATDQPNMRVKAFKGGGRAEGLEIRMQEAVYLSSAHMDLQRAATEAAGELSRLSGISDFSYKADTLNLEGELAIWQHGSYRYQQSVPMEFDHLVAVKGGSRVQLLVTHRGDDDTGRQVAKKIMRSARLN